MKRLEISPVQVTAAAPVSLFPKRAYIADELFENRYILDLYF
jgi:hypothetical protein